LNRCPVCDKELKIFQWYEDGRLQEWLCQCVDCNYMKHYYYGNYEISIGTWHSYIRKNYSNKKSQMISFLFYREIAKAKKKILKK
jgi:Zn ribbon nucleic-acid-binding protein